MLMQISHVSMWEMVLDDLAGQKCDLRRKDRLVWVFESLLVYWVVPSALLEGENV